MVTRVEGEFSGVHPVPGGEEAVILDGVGGPLLWRFGEAPVSLGVSGRESAFWGDTLVTSAGVALPWPPGCGAAMRFEYGAAPVGAGAVLVGGEDFLLRRNGGDFQIAYGAPPQTLADWQDLGWRSNLFARRREAELVAVVPLVARFAAVDVAGGVRFLTRGGRIETTIAAGVAVHGALACGERLALFGDDAVHLLDGSGSVDALPTGEPSVGDCGDGELLLLGASELLAVDPGGGPRHIVREWDEAARPVAVVTVGGWIVALREGGAELLSR